MWFPPIEGTEVPFCKIDVTLATAGTIYVDDEDNIYIASARGEPGRLPLQRAVPDLGRRRRRVREDRPHRRADGRRGAARAVHRAGREGVDAGRVMGSPDGTFFVSSVITGVIAEYDADGEFVRTVLEPPAGEQLGAEPFSTGTPLGLGFGPDGTLYYADLGIVIGDGIGPGPETGTVRRIRFIDGEPQPPRSSTRASPTPTASASTCRDTEIGDGCAAHCARESTAFQ